MFQFTPRQGWPNGPFGKQRKSISGPSCEDDMDADCQAIIYYVVYYSSIGNRHFFPNLGHRQCVVHHSMRYAVSLSLIYCSDSNSNSLSPSLSFSVSLSLSRTHRHTLLLSGGTRARCGQTVTKYISTHKTTELKCSCQCTFLPK